MRKLIALLVAAIMCFSLVACAATEGDNTGGQTLNTVSNTYGTQDTSEDTQQTAENGYFVNHSGEIVLTREKLISYLQFVEITPENWKEYCKFEAKVYEQKNGFGEVTDSSTQYELSLKDFGEFTYTWYNPLNENRQDSVSVDFLNHANDERFTQDQLAGDPLLWYGHSECTIDDLELLRIAGTLVLLMVPEEYWNDSDSERAYILCGDDDHSFYIYQNDAPYHEDFVPIVESALSEN